MGAQGHGDHWECVTSTDELVEKHLPKLLKDGGLEDKTDVNAIFFEEGISKKTIFSFAKKDDFTQLVLIATNEKKNVNELLSVYPFVRNGVQLLLKITDIQEWQNKFEAVIEGETSDGNTISFFDTKYYLNKEKYIVGNSYVFALSSFAYMAEVLREEERSFLFEGEQATEWLAKSGRSPELDASGNIEPIQFDLSKLVAFLPNKETPEDVQFQSPIESVEKLSALDTDFYKLNICVFCDPEKDTSVYLDLYAKARFFEKEPQKGDPIRGVAWIQGYLKED